MKKAIATAIYQDTYFGAVKASLVAFPTTRAGVRVTRYRWVPEHGYVSATFKTIDGAIDYAKRHLSDCQV